MGSGSDVGFAVFSIAGFVLFHVSLVTTEWVVITTPVVIYRAGLFQVCDGLPISDVEFCRDRQPVGVSKNAAILMIIAATMYGIGVILHIISCCTDRDGCIRTATPVIYFIGALFNLLAAGLYASQINGNVFGSIKTHLGYSFHLAWVAGGLMTFAAVLGGSLCCC